MTGVTGPEGSRPSNGEPMVRTGGTTRQSTGQPYPERRREPSLRGHRFAIAAAFFAQGCVFAIVLTHLGAFESAWQLDDLAITIIMFSVAILAAVGSVVAGVLAARWTSSVALRTGLFGIAVAIAIAALAPNLIVFCAGLAVYGVALGCVDATTNMQAVACEAVAGRSIMTSFYAAWSIGGILGALETSVSAHWPLTASLLVALIPPLAAMRLPLLPAGLVDAQAGMTAGPAATAAGPRNPDSASSRPAERDGAAITGAMDPDAPDRGERHTHLTLPWKPLAILGVAIVLFYIADSATQSWSTIYLGGVLGATAAVAPLGYAAYQATSLVSRLTGDLLVRRLGPTAVVRLAADVGAVGLLLAVVARGPALAIIGFAVLGLGIAVVAPLTFAAAGRLADAQPGAGTDPALRRRAADAIVARINQFNYLGFVLGGVLTGLVASASSMRAGFAVPLVGIALILPIAGAFGRRPPASQRDRVTPAAR